MMRIGPIIVASILAGLARPANAQLAAIEILAAPPGSNRSFPGWRGAAPFPSAATIHLEPGDEVAAQTVRLEPSPGSELELRLQVQFETSLSVENKGPHLDLLDWKHCTSDWRDADRLSAFEFRIPQPSETDSTCFPPVTAAEIQEAVRTAGSDHYTELVRGVQGPHDYPLGVSLSTVRLRVQVKRGRSWSDVTVISVRVPMGC